MLYRSFSDPAQKSADLPVTGIIRIPPKRVKPAPRPETKKSGAGGPTSAQPGEKRKKQHRDRDKAIEISEKYDIMYF